MCSSNKLYKLTDEDSVCFFRIYAVSDDNCFTESQWRGHICGAGGTLIYLKEFGLYSSIFYLILYIFYSFEVVLLMKILFFPFFLYYIESLWQQIENSLGANSKYG